MDANFSLLCHAIGGHIFAFLPIDDFFLLGHRVCKHWHLFRPVWNHFNLSRLSHRRAVAWTAEQHVNTVVFDGGPEDDFGSLQRFTCVQTLDFTDSKLAPWAQLQNAPKLMTCVEALSLRSRHHRHIARTPLELINWCGTLLRLQSITLSSAFTMCDLFKCLGDLPNLRSFELEHHKDRHVIADSLEGDNPRFEETLLPNLISKLVSFKAPGLLLQADIVFSRELVCAKLRHLACELYLTPAEDAFFAQFLTRHPLVTYDATCPCKSCQCSEIVQKQLWHDTKLNFNLTLACPCGVLYQN